MRRLFTLTAMMVIVALTATAGYAKADLPMPRHYVEDYAKAMAEQGVKKQIEDGMKDGLHKFLIENREEMANGRVPEGDGDDVEWASVSKGGIEFKSGWTGRETKAEFAATPKTRKDTAGFKSPAEYYTAIWDRVITQKGGPDARLKDLSVGIGGDGGYLVPEALRAQLFSVDLEMAIVRPRATIIPMESLTVPFPTVEDTSHASNIFGGIVANWTAENTTITETQPSFGRVTLEAKKLALYTEVPAELMQDSIISLEGFLNQIYPQAVGYFEDDAFLVGGGAGRPLGAISASNTALIAQARDTTGAVLWEDIVNMYARMLPSSIGRAVWIINQEVFPQLATMSLNVGTGGSAVWLSNGVGGPPATILGRPVLITEKAPALGSQADISFVDFSMYLLGDRQTVTMSTSTHFKFQQDQVAIRGTERVDGQPWMRSALTPRNGTNTLSPYVALAA